ncbi:MAG TPA: hypothetical protein VFI65_11725 [Streptosporangiaceae bacterium]|nr:hypothetical protein [Streptosporangiaceae bacterium]
MSVRTVELNTTRQRKVEAGSVIAYAGAAAFVIAATWYALALHNITQAGPPQVGPKVSAVRGLHLFYRWFASTLPQERLYTVIAIAGFGCLAAVALAVRDQLGLGNTRVARTSALAIVAGSAVWIASNIAQLGGHRAIGLMATHANPIQAVNSIAFTIDTTASALELTAFVLIGAGMLGFAYAARPQAGYRVWTGLSAALGLLMLVLAWTYASGPNDLTDWLLPITGVAAVPAWLILTTRVRTVSSIS